MTPTEAPAVSLAQVIAKLSPSSLLAISRTSRFFRRLVLTKRAEPIWANAKKRDGWVDLPTMGWSEIEYAKMVSKDACQVCDLRLPVAD